LKVRSQGFFVATQKRFGKSGRMETEAELQPSHNLLVPVCAFRFTLLLPRLTDERSGGFPI
jgi:hypothetical protein